MRSSAPRTMHRRPRTSFLAWNARCPERRLWRSAIRTRLISSGRKLSGTKSESLKTTVILSDLPTAINRQTSRLQAMAPGSAIRELISNAYDADATRVVIKTDAPRFERISVEDDGHGMEPEALAHL